MCHDAEGQTHINTIGGVSQYFYGHVFPYLMVVLVQVYQLLLTVVKSGFLSTYPQMSHHA